MHWIEPTQLPIVRGIIERFVVNGQGELDGLVLDIGAGAIKLVHFPSHMADDVAASLKVGDPIGVRGLRPRDADVIGVVALECPDGKQIADQGPPKHTASRGETTRQWPMSAAGRIRLTLYNSKGKASGALLDDGTILRMPLKQAEQIRQRLQPGETIEIQGNGRETANGRVIEVNHIATPRARFDVLVKSTRRPYPNLNADRSSQRDSGD